MPDVEQGVMALLSAALTSAAHIGTDQGPGRQKLPNVVVEHDGGFGIDADLRMEQARIVIEARAMTREAATSMAYEVRDVILPPANIVEGVHTTVEYEDGVSGQTRIIHFSGARFDALPRFSPDNRDTPRVIASYMITYFGNP